MRANFLYFLNDFRDMIDISEKEGKYMFQFSNQELVKEVSILEDKLKKISKDLWSVKYELRTLDPSKQDKATFLKNQMDQYEQEESLLKKEVETKKRCFHQAIQLEFMDYVSNVNLNNAFYVSLDTKTDTVVLMDSFIESKKDFLVLKDQFIQDDSKISLIITIKIKDFEVKNTKISLIDLKVNAHKNIQDIISLNLRPLLNACKEHTHEYVVFEKPFMIQRQVSSDRSQNGSRWCCGISNNEGSIYGDVTEFFIAGFKREIC